MANKYKHLSKTKKRYVSGKHKSWVKGCVGKKRLSLAIADLVIERERKNVTLYKYYCGTCDSFHLTRTKQNA